MMAYFPNATAGEVLDAQCGACPVMVADDTQCPVQLVQMMFNYDQCNKGNEQLKQAMSILINDDGICQMRQSLMNRPETRDQSCDECGNLFDLSSIGQVMLCEGCIDMLAEREK